jgi:hypothetical protein
MSKKSDTNVRSARVARAARIKRAERSDGSRASSVVKDKRGVALSILARYYPFLLKEHREDTLQDLEVFLLESKQKELKPFSNEVQRYFYQRAKAYGWRRPKGSKGFVKELSAFPRELGED